MTDLAARLEQAPEGTRELSDEVLLAVGWDCGPPGWTSDRPDPTRDLTDIAALVEATGRWWSVDKDEAGVDLADGQPNYVPTNGRPALALCIALVKAQEKPNA